MTSRIAVTPQTHRAMKDFAIGADVHFDDAIRYLLAQLTAGEKEPLLVGHELRDKIKAWVETNPIPGEETE